MVAAILLLSALSLVSASPSIPRGVSPGRAALYKPHADGKFTCLTAPTVSIPIDAVNNNYCDCPDGSDEPGTAACSHLGLHQLSIPGFYCANKGWHPRYLPLNRVDDGVCDYDLCCDGSDEPKGKCKDQCGTLGKERLKAEEASRKARAEGVRARMRLENEARKLVNDLRQQKKNLEAEVKQTEKEVERLKAVLKTVEEEEKNRVVQHKADEVPNILYDLAISKLTNLRSALKAATETRDSALERLERAEAILKQLKDTYNPNFNDEGVKAAVSAYENHISTYPSPLTAEGSEDSLLNDDDSELAQAAEADNADKRKHEAPSDIEQLWGFTSYLPPSLQASITHWLHSAREFLVENGILMRSEHSTSDSTSSDYISPQLKKAQDSLSTAEGIHSAASKKLNDLTNDISTQYGPNDVFRSLKNKCVSKDEAGYTYSLCFWGSATQKSLRDGSSVSLGDFKSFAVLDEAGIEAARLASQGVFNHIPEEDESDSDMGSDGSDEVVLQYADGLGCWNGPRRSAKVRLVCKAEEVLLEVREAEKCVYEMVVGTGAVCKDGTERKKPEERVQEVSGKKKSEDVKGHDEL